MKGGQGRHQHLPAFGHRGQQLGRAVQRQPVLDRVDTLLDRHPRALQPFGVGGDPEAHAVGLVHDRGQLGGHHLRGLGILAHHRTRAGCHYLDEAGAGADLLAHRLAHLVGPVRLPVHGAEDGAAR